MKNMSTSLRLRLLVVCLMLIAVLPVNAGMLVEDERITDILLGPWGTDSFAVKVSAGSETVTHCHDRWVVFLKDNFVEPGAYDKAYAQVIAAITARQSVIIIGADESCQTAIGIASF